MADQLYENWWMNLTEPNCGIYYRGTWYSSESELNTHGYYIVYNRTLYLGSFHQEYKYQNIYYLMGDDYKTYAQAHSLGYSENVSYTYHFIKTETLEYLEGYYNSTDGYYVEGVWYDSLQELNMAGYQVGEKHTYIFRKSFIKRYDAIVRVWNNITQYFINDSEINYWFTESDMDSLDLQFLPSVEINWNLGRSFSNNVGHGGHSTYSANFYQLLRNGVSISLSEMDSIFGYQAARTEYNCSGAYVGNYKTDAIGEKLWLECYNGSSGSARQNLIASFYMSNTSRNLYNTDYMLYQRIAICYGKDVSVVKIYDACNLSYSAFKFIYNKNTYYYPCDGEEHEWILESDLHSFDFFLSERDGVYKINAYAYTSSIEIPQGYNITAIKSFSFWVYPEYVNDSDIDTVTYKGRNLYTRSISSYMLQKSSGSLILPRLYVLQGYSSSDRNRINGTIYTASYSASSQWSSLTETSVNKEDSVLGSYSICLKGDSNGYISYANSGFPAWVVLYPNYNSNNTDLNSFNVPNSLYRKNNNFIEWIGDIDDKYGLAYYYYNQYLNIYLYAENESDRIREIELLDIVNYSIQKIEYWPNRGYKFNSQFYTEAQLLNIGYHPINHTKKITAYCDIEGQSSILACYNVTSGTTSFNTSSYRHPVLVNGEPFLYDGSCDIIVEENSKKVVTRLSEMPSSTTGNSVDAHGLYSIFTANTNPRKPLNTNVINQQLVFMISSNYNSNIYYTAPSPITLLIDPFKLPVYENVLIKNNTTGDFIISNYNSSSGYLIKDVGTFRTERDLNNAGYSLVNNQKMYLALPNSRYYDTSWYSATLYSDESLNTVIKGDTNNPYYGTVAEVIELYGASGTYPNITWSKAKIDLGNNTVGYVAYNNKIKLLLLSSGLIPLYQIPTELNTSYNTSYLESSVTNSTTSLSSSNSVTLYKDISCTTPLSDTNAKVNVSLAQDLYGTGVVTRLEDMPSNITSDSSQKVYIFLLDPLQSPIRLYEGTNSITRYGWSIQPVCCYDSETHIIYVVSL